jgi:hypothetical protein
MQLYERYRDGQIRRHITAQGRVFQHILLSEIPDERFSENVCDVSKKAGGQSVTYRGYPVMVDNKMVGGGDNPMLYGGLLIAQLSLEQKLGVSAHSIHYATHLVDYVRASMYEGLPRRQRHAWHPVADCSKDELSGLLLGLHFYCKVATGAARTHAIDLLRTIAETLKASKYRAADAWVWQFPFTRVFKFTLGASYLGGSTVPKAGGIVDAFAVLRQLARFRFRYTPKDLYGDVIAWMPSIYRLALATNQQPNFYNVAMLCHTLLMIADNPVDRKVRDSLWPAVWSMYRYFSAAGRDGHRNAYLALCVRALARQSGRFVSTPQLDWLDASNWQDALPLRALSRSTSFSDEQQFGRDFCWSHRDGGLALDWYWAKTLREIGPASMSQLNGSAHYRVEGAGLGYTFPRILAAYLGIKAPPRLEHDDVLPVLPPESTPDRHIWPVGTLPSLPFSLRGR